MSAGVLIRSVEDMNSTHSLKALDWPLIIILGAFTLVRPATRIVSSQLGVSIWPPLPIALTVGITIVWVAVVILRRVERPLITLVMSALTYGVLSILLSGILSPILDGRLDGPLAHPIAIVPDLAVNAVWGLVAGALALGIQRVPGLRPLTGR